ncbi:MAG: amidohydrolase family protein [Terracidiphilus sp.]
MMRSPIPVLDSHGHLRLGVKFPYKTEPAQMLQVMDDLNIEALAVTASLACWNDCPSGNVEVDEVLRKFGARFRGYITVNPLVPGEALLELEKWKHFHSPPLIKLHPAAHQYPVNGPAYAPIWDYANQTGAVVLVHTWDSHPHCSPLMFPAIGRAHPRANILMGHSGVTWRGYEQAQEAATAAPNLYLELSGSQRNRTMLARCVNRVGAERIVFGSDMPALDPAGTLADVFSAKIVDADKEKILRYNFLRLLGEG